MSVRRLNSKREIRAAVWAASGGVCHHCKVSLDPFVNFQLDHLVPLVLGGEDTFDNLVGSCATCNTKRGHEATRQARELAAKDDPEPAQRMSADDVRKRRAAMGISQEELARRLSATRQSVYMWERGETRPPGMLNLALRWLEHEMGVEPKEVRDA